MSDIGPIRTEADYRAMLAQVSALIDIDPEPGTPEGERLMTLVRLVQAWEREHYPLPEPSESDLLEFELDLLESDHPEPTL